MYGRFKLERPRPHSHISRSLVLQKKCHKTKRKIFGSKRLSTPRNNSVIFFKIWLPENKMAKIISIVRNCSSTHYNLGSDFPKKTSLEIKFVEREFWRDKIEKGKGKVFCNPKETSTWKGGREFIFDSGRKRQNGYGPGLWQRT